MQLQIGVYARDAVDGGRHRWKLMESGHSILSQCLLTSVDDSPTCIISCQVRHRIGNGVGSVHWWDHARFEQCTFVLCFTCHLGCIRQEARSWSVNPTHTQQMDVVSAEDRPSSDPSDARDFPKSGRTAAESAQNTEPREKESVTPDSAEPFCSQQQNGRQRQALIPLCNRTIEQQCTVQTYPCHCRNAGTMRTKLRDMKQRSKRFFFFLIGSGFRRLKRIRFRVCIVAQKACASVDTFYRTPQTRI